MAASVNASKKAQVFEYATLESADLANIGEAFGEDGLGFLVVRNVPGYAEARKRLLPLIRQFATLPQETKELYVREDLKYQFGWSHGKEVLENGNLDVAKGSYYANPDVTVGKDDGDANLSAKNNVWPTQHVPELEIAFKQVSKIMIETATKIAKLCDDYLRLERGVSPTQSLEHVVRTSSAAKGRLLYYFPQSSPSKQSEDSSKWCGWHCDHGSLTCLTKAMYFDAAGTQVTDLIGDDLAIETSDGLITHLRIPEDCIGFQIGQAAQINSGSLLRATPHCVTYPPHANVSRCTYALFLQPNPSDLLAVPKQVQLAKKPLPAQYETGMTFGGFAQATIDRTYKFPPARM